MKFQIKSHAWVALMLSCFFLSCLNIRKSMDSWMGDTKQDLILKKGPPERVTSDGAEGQILIYSAQSYNAYTRQVQYAYAFYYANSNGILYHWMVKTGTVPPQQMNVDLYIH